MKLGKLAGNKLYLFVILFALAVAMADYFQIFIFARPEPLDFVDETVRFTGVVVTEPEPKEFNTRLTVRVTTVPIIASDLVDKKIMVTIERYGTVEYSYGDVVDVVGKIEVPENFETETGREFDYIEYLAAKGISYQVRLPQITVVGHDPPSRIVALLIKIKQGFVARIESSLSEPQSALASGILIDGKRSINATLQEEFKKAGIVHIVVLSGYNVTIVAETIFKMCSAFLPRLAGIGGAAFGIILFAFMTGTTSTVFRASVMALLALLSRASFRNYDPGRSLFLAAFIMLVFNPRLLLHDPSFQLSFLATFAVIFVVPHYARFFSWLPERFGLRDLISGTVIVQLFLLPILIYMSGTVSLVAFPVNFIVVPFIPFAMLVSFITACVEFFSHVFAFPFAFVAHLILSYILGIAHTASSLSFAEIGVGNLSAFMMAIVYAVIGALTVRVRNSLQSRSS